MVLWGWGRKNGVTFCLFCGFITVPQSTDSLSYLSNAVFQSYIYMLCSIWPASILLNKVLRLSKKNNKTNSLIWFDCWHQMKYMKFFHFSYILYIVWKPLVRMTPWLEYAHQNQSKMAEYQIYPAATLCIQRKSLLRMKREHHAAVFCYMASLVGIH